MQLRLAAALLLYLFFYFQTLEPSLSVKLKSLKNYDHGTMLLSTTDKEVSTKSGTSLSIFYIKWIRKDCSGSATMSFLSRRKVLRPDSTSWQRKLAGCSSGPKIKGDYNFILF